MNDKRRFLPSLALFTLLLLLALRLTISESTQDSYLPADPGTADIRQPGPATTVTFTIVTLLAAATTALSHRLTRRDILHLALLAAILTFSTFSTFHAANRFTALVGTCDLAIALIAGWSFSLLLATPAHRQFLFCVLIALTTTWIAKSAYQYFSEIPETINFYQDHKADILAQHHWQPGDPNQVLFEARMNSHEVTGFFPLSNAFAAALLAPLLLSAAFLTLLFSKRPAPNAQLQPSKKNSPSPTPHSSFIVHRSSFLVLFLLTLAALYLTDSKGALAAALIALSAFLFCYLFSNSIYRHRRPLTLTLFAAATLFTTATLAYGLTHHALPTRSLLFRWQYWTGTLPIIKSHSLLGTGLNNFNTYYLQHKLPSSPEDVSDPHSFFLRLAAEQGLPLTLLIAGLLLCLILRPLLANLPSQSSVLSPQSLAPPPPSVPSANDSLSSFIVHRSSFLLIPLWFLLRFLIAEPLTGDATLFAIYLNIFYALIAAAGFFLAASALRRLPASAIQPLTYSLLAAALAMFLYDQINMALVTGPVAMLFYTLLAATQPAPSADHSVLSPQSSVLTAPSSFIIQRSAFLIFLLPALILTLLFPSLLNNTFPWDPAPLAQQATQALSLGNYSSALPLLQSARARDPRSLQLLRWQVQAKLALHQPAADDIRQILTLNPTDAHTHLDLAQLDSDLPTPERLTAAQQALSLNTQLAPDEPKRLSDFQLQQAATLITQLRAATQKSP